jgi:hypothetical protein
MTFIEGLQLLTSSGVLAGGLGVLKWALSIERRMMRVELKNGIKT